MMRKGIRYIRYRLAWFWADLWRGVGMHDSAEAWRAGNHPTTRRWKF